MHGWIDIATLIHSKNLDGRLVAHSAAGLSFPWKEGMRVALVPPSLEGPRFVHVESVSLLHNDDAEIFFEEVTSIDDATELIGKHCLVQREDLDEVALLSFEGHGVWKGWRVVDDEAGFIGELLMIDERAYQSLLVIKDTAGKEVLVPLVDEFIDRIDEDDRTLYLTCPAGLLDL